MHQFLYMLPLLCRCRGESHGPPRAWGWGAVVTLVTPVVTPFSGAKSVAIWYLLCPLQTLVGELGALTCKGAVMTEISYSRTFHVLLSSLFCSKFPVSNNPCSMSTVFYHLL